MTGPHRHGVAVATAVLALALVAAACGTTNPAASTTTSHPGSTTGEIPTSAFSDRTGLTSSSVRIGNISTLTAGLFSGSPIGSEAYADYVNSTGGINGRKLVVDSLDDNFTGAGNAQGTRQAIGQDFALVGGFSLEDSYGASVLAGNPGVPDVGESIALQMNALKNYYSAIPLQPGYQGGALQYFKQKYPDDVSAVGELIGNLPSNATTWTGVKYAMTKSGYKVVYLNSYTVTQTDFTADVVAMKNAGVKMVFTDQMNDTYASSLLKDMVQQNFHPVVILGAATYTNDMVAEAGGASAINGDQLSMQYSLYLGQDEAHIPADATFLHWIQVASPGTKANLFTLYGWLSAEMFAQALKQAGADPSRGSLLQALARITTFNGQGLIAPTDPAARTISNCYLQVQVVNGQFVRVDDPPISGPTGGFRCNAGFLSPGAS